MSLIDRKKFFRALAIAVGLLAGNTAQGIVFKGNFDPPLYGGTVFVDVAPGCIVGGIQWINTSTCGGAVDISSLVVNSPLSQPVDQLTFAPPTITGMVWGLYWNSGVLAAIDTFFIDRSRGDRPGIGR